MTSGDSEKFELDEPAANSHTPPGWPIHTIDLVPIDKAPKKYGPSTYRFGAAMTLSVILPRRGWTLVKKTKSYVYVIPPLDQTSPPFHISIAVPTPQECLEIARRSYAKGQSWMGQLGKFPRGISTKGSPRQRRCGSTPRLAGGRRLASISRRRSRVSRSAKGAFGAVLLQAWPESLRSAHCRQPH